MNRWNRRLPSIVSLVALFLLSCMARGAQPSPTASKGNAWLPITEDVNGRLTEIEGIPLLTLWGTPYEQGYAHGYLYAPEIIEYTEIELEQEGLVDLYETVVLPNLGKYSIPDEYVQEMQGMLDGMNARAGGAVYLAAVDRHLTIDDIKATVCIDNIESILETNCTSFCAWDSLTTDAHPITGYNKDDVNHATKTGRYILIVRKPDPQSGIPPWICIALPGAIHCDTGMNREGVTLARQAVNLTHEVTASDGFCPEDLLYRRLLESAGATAVVADVSAVLQELYTNGGEAIFLSWPSGQGACSAVFEIDGNLTMGHGFTVRQPETGFPYMIQTNQFYKRLDPSASDRYALIQGYLEGIISGDNPPLSVETTWEILGQVPSSEDLIIQNAVVYEPDKMLMHVAFAEPGVHATNCRRITIDVEELLR